MNTLWRDFENKIGIHFLDQSQLITALTHASLIHQKPFSQEEDNERLEFFGDSVVKLVVSEYLMLKYPKAREGELTKRRAWLVSDKCLSVFARELDLGSLLRMSFGEEKSGGRERTSTLANAFEALVGAIFLDQGLDTSRNFLYTLLKENWEKIHRDAGTIDHKTTLQEWSQQQRIPLPEYRISDTQGPDHAKQFFVEVVCQLPEKTYSFKGSGVSRKEAEQAAAHEAIVTLHTKSQKKKK